MSQMAIIHHALHMEMPVAALASLLMLATILLP